MRRTTQIVPALMLIFFVGCKQDNSAAVETLRVSGATVSQGMGGEPRTIRYHDGTPTADDIKKISGITELQEIHARAPDAGDQEFALIANMPSLSVLSLTETNATSKAIESLAASKSLISLDISGASALTDADLKPLVGNSRLKVLNLSGIPLTDEIADVVGSLSSLEELSLVGTRITATTVQRLAEQNTSIRLLSVGSESITEEIVPLIAKFDDLETLEITNSAISGDSFSVWVDLPKLKSIRLTDCANLTNEAIMQLADVAELYKLDVSGTKFTAMGLNKKGFAKLNILDANRTKVTDELIPQFKGLPVLFSVNVRGSEVTESGVRAHFPANHQTQFGFGSL